MRLSGYEEIAAEVLVEAAQIDADEDERFGAARGDELPEHLSTRGGRRAWLRKAEQRLDAERAADPEPVPRDREERHGWYVRLVGTPVELRDVRRGDHAAPVARCRCGIYALHEPEPRLLFRDGLVWGAVALDGRVLLYGNGLRAERATVLVLAYAGDEPQPDLAGAAQALDLELVPFSALIAAAGAYGAAPAPDPLALKRERAGDADGAWDALSPPSGPRPLAAVASLRG